MLFTVFFLQADMYAGLITKGQFLFALVLMGLVLGLFIEYQPKE